MTVSMKTQQPWVELGPMPGHAELGLSLPLSVREGQWRWGWWWGRGRGRCRGLRGRGLLARRHRKTSAESETRSSPGRQPLGTPLDGRTPLQEGHRQPHTLGQSGGPGAFTYTHNLCPAEALPITLLHASSESVAGREMGERACAEPPGLTVCECECVCV